MRSTIANLKENLNKIAQVVHDDDDDVVQEFGIYGSFNGDEASPSSDRRNSHSFAHHSPLSNGIDSPFNPEIEQYKAEIKRLQESETEIKALSKNYAALLKEKEDQISRLNKEKGSLKQNLDATYNESLKASANANNVLKGTSDQSPNRQHKLITQGKNRNSGNQLHNGVSKLDGISNGTTHLQRQEREFADVLEENNRLRAAVHANPEMRLLQRELVRERDHVANIKLKLKEKHKLNESLQQELKSLKLDRDRTFTELRKTRGELNENISAMKRLQSELNRQEEEGPGDILENLKRSVAILEKENATLKMEMNELKVALEMSRMSANKKTLDVPEALTKHQNTSYENVDSPESSSGREEMAKSLLKLDKELKETRHERDKALQELARLKQHLLEKESEESEKMDEDSKVIEELRQNSEYQKAQILHLEKALKQAIASQEEFKMTNSNEIHKSKEIVDDLNKKLASCLSTLDAKNVELLNLQTALGQYYAEIEAKEHLEADLARAREESAKMSGLLKEANNQSEAHKREKEEFLSKLSQTESILTDWKVRVSKLEEDNAKLRHAVEHSMTRLNRMSVDSDYLVDRRIVIKLLVTYFQRSHSKEVLDLMVKMLGFSDEDKQRIGVAQQGSGKGVVRGVLGLPGRLVGGILGGGSADAAATMASENQSFADLWVDFLLKETEEREKREAMDNATKAKSESHKSPNFANSSSATDDHRSIATGAASAFARKSWSPSQNRSNLGLSEHSDSEFSTVPLTSSESNVHSSRLPPKY